MSIQRQKSATMIASTRANEPNPKKRPVALSAFIGVRYLSTDRKWGGDRPHCYPTVPPGLRLRSEARGPPGAWTKPAAFQLPAAGTMGRPWTKPMVAHAVPWHSFEIYRLGPKTELFAGSSADLEADQFRRLMPSKSLVRAPLRYRARRGNCRESLQC